MIDRNATWSLAVTLILLALPLVVGCDGCRQNPEAPQPESKTEPIEDLTMPSPRPMPGDENASQNSIKPGHWFTASQSLRSNKNDMRGTLRSSVGSTSVSTPDPDAVDPADERQVGPNIVCERPVVLPKGQTRRFDVRLLAPRSGGNLNQRLQLSSRVVGGGQVTMLDQAIQECVPLMPQEYYLVVLTTTPQRFARLQTSFWARPYRDTLGEGLPSINYRFVFPKNEGVIPLAPTMLDWTPTAVVIWDDVSPDSLTPAQSQALRDWVHFGGRLIVNGSTASAELASSSLGDLLPIQVQGNAELDVDHASELLVNWSVMGDPSTEKQSELVQSLGTRVAVAGDVRPEATGVPGTNDLLIRVNRGRGTVMQARFDLTSDWLANWESFDSFFNAAILQRPGRTYVTSTTQYQGGSIEGDIGLVLEQFADESITPEITPALNTQLRIAARDATLIQTRESPEASSDAAITASPPTASADGTSSDSPSSDGTSPDGTSATQAEESNKLGILSDTRVDPIAGVGGWNDASDVVTLVRNILRSESGIEIPQRALILRSLGVYLLVLVPLNYLIFWLIGRLEYAWLAAPLIAIVGAVWVARAAQLDIGFARSQTEVAFVELPGGYTRAHVTRGVAIYNSLSTTYQFDFTTEDAVAAPFSSTATQSNKTQIVFQTSTGSGPQLLGMNVESNQVRMMRAEHMLDCGGVIRREGGFLINETRFELVDLHVVEHTSINNVVVASVASCSAGGRVPLKFRPGKEVFVSNDLPMQTASLMRPLLSPERLEVGASQLVCRIESELDGLSIVPPASQRSSVTLMLAHLRYGDPTPVTGDTNLVSMLLKDRPKNLEPTDPLIQDEP